MAIPPPPQLDHDTVFAINGKTVKLGRWVDNLQVSIMGTDVQIEATSRRMYRSLEDAIEDGALIAVHDAEPGQQIPPGGATVQWQE